MLGMKWLASTMDLEWAQREELQLLVERLATQW